MAFVITLRVRHSRIEMYSGRSRLSVPRRIPVLQHGPESNNWEKMNGSGPGCPLVVQYWADFQSVHGFSSYDNIHVYIAPNAKCQRVLVLAICLVEHKEASTANHWRTNISSTRPVTSVPLFTLPTHHSVTPSIALPFSSLR